MRKNARASPVCRAAQVLLRPLCRPLDGPVQHHPAPARMCPFLCFLACVQGFRSPYLDTNPKVRQVLADAGFEYDR